ILLQRVVLLAFYEWIVRAIEDEDLRFDGSWRGRWGIETKRCVKARNGGEVSARTRHVQHDRAAEAVTNGADPLGIDRGLLGELATRCVKARLHHRRVLHHRTRERAGVFRVVSGLGVTV